MLQQDLQAAIKSLETSTAAINRQGEVLKAQQKYLDSVRNGRVEELSVSQTKQLEVQNLVLAVEESHESLMSQLRELQEGLQSQTKQAIASATDHLSHDDYCLQKLAAASGFDVDDGKNLRDKVTKLTAKLSELNREEIQCRLDRIYLQRLMGNDPHEVLAQSEFFGEHELEQDLKSLHVEIPDVAAMSVFQEFTAPVFRTMTEQQSKKNKEARSVLENISNSMTVLTEATETCANRLEVLQAYQTDVSAYAKEVRARAAEFALQIEARQRGGKTSEIAISPAMTDMLYHWNVLLSENGSTEKALLDRKRKVRQDVLQSGSAIEDILQTHLGALPANVERLVESKPLAEKDMADLEEDMHKLRQAMDSVDLGLIDKESEAQSRFLARWAERPTTE